MIQRRQLTFVGAIVSLCVQPCGGATVLRPLQPIESKGGVECE